MSVYDKIDITGSTFKTYKQNEPATRGSIPSGNDFANGVYMLQGEDGAKLEQGNYRIVEGTLVVPIACFVNSEEFSGLHLRAEVYSDADSPDFHDGLYSSDHNEYNAGNNTSELTLKHQTVFSAPEHITTALGTTLTLPVTFSSTAAKSDIVLTEISDGTENWEPRMGVCYYDADRGVIVAAPNAAAQAMIEARQTPTGILQLTDVSTNSITAIAYTVGAMGSGINVYRDDTSGTRTAARRICMPRRRTIPAGCSVTRASTCFGTAPPPESSR